jgi:lysophospholipase L1-like esterase
MDYYNPRASWWQEIGFYEECKHYYGVMNEIIHRVAEGHSIFVAEVYEAFKGGDGEEDPAETGYLIGDGLHSNEAGRAVIAQALRALGYEFVEP